MTRIPAPGIAIRPTEQVVGTSTSHLADSQVSSSDSRTAHPRTALRTSHLRTPHHTSHSGTQHSALLGLFLFAALASACHGGARGALEGKASDVWSRSYPLAEGAEFQIIDRTGSIEVTGGDGQTVEVKAERVARALNDASAQEIVPRIRIREDVAPEKIVLQTEGLEGIMVGVEIQVNYKVTVPRSARLRLREVNGPVTVANVDGRVVASTTNGAVTVRSQGPGGLEARSVNGDLAIDLARFAETVDLRTTNGNVELAVPADISASLLLNVQNGKMAVDGLPFESNGEQNRRRMRGRLGTGGTPIEVGTVNGNIAMRPRQ